MSNEIQKFINDKFGEITTVTINGVPWFVGKEIAQILGYQNTSSKAIRTHVNKNDRKALKYKAYSESCLSDLWVGNDFSDKITINEYGLYDLIFGSKLESAKDFKSWVTHEILPTIRKTGGYVAEDREAEFIENYFPSFSEETKKQMVLDLQSQNKQLKEQLEQQQPLVEAALVINNSDGWLDIKEVANIIVNRIDDVNYGRNKLFALLREKGILMSGSHQNEPYQKYVNQGYFKSFPTKKHNGELTAKTFASGKGLIWTNNKVRDWLGLEPDSNFREYLEKEGYIRVI